MTKTLYVGNLPWSATEDDLSQTFSPYCEVSSCRIITDRETGRSRGFGFVEINADEDTDKVVKALDGLLMDGRPLKVNEARPRQSGY